MFETRISSPGSLTPTTASRRSSSVAGHGYELAKPLPGAIKKVARQRSSSLAVKLLGKAAPAGFTTAVPALTVSVIAKDGLEGRVAVSLEGARPQGRGLPASVSSGSTATATYLAPPALPGGTKGSVEIGVFGEPIRFFLASGGQGSSWVGSAGRWKYTALHVESWNWRENGQKPSEGQAADLELAGKEMKIVLRAMSAMELKRSLQLQALREATEEDDYDSLRAQVTKARMASVEMEHIAKGEAKLKELKGQGLHVNEGCDRNTIREQMDVSKITSKLGAPDVNEPCTICSDCPCNVPCNPGEALEFSDDAVQDCLKDCPGADLLLFQSLVEAALAVEEGCVWKAGGKFIFSEFNRNQSVTALTRMLHRVGKIEAADMITRLVAYTETKYSGFVTAIQVNFHPHRGTYHDQHRDIYSQKQSAGPNCTCQFQECVGTVCYSLGSSRLVLLETMTDELSAIRPCASTCEGRSEMRWLHSGNAMFFNTEWNNNHTHGIPPSEEEVGPRISLAFLLAAKPPPFCKI
eukprot:TRINITY_DN106568_c0_g1_i1.p1 TRINITY_DN106568_c0_g1~~TRINITY_DN106568_c0_g1_i1.p1  ORF type:complete len:523 (+),score=112.04 TRINITY_DN106568_c0_g1_i1:31-1599(+)